MQDLEALRSELTAAIDGAGDLDALEAVRVAALGRKGSVTGLMKTLGRLDADERKAAGQAFNALKDEIAEAIDARKTALSASGLDARLAEEKIDVTLPVRPERKGYVHPISQTIDEVISIFGEMGFTVAEGPDIEEDWYNFTALNIPQDHPARQEHDTFYINAEKEGRRMVLRTHTSPVQIRTHAVPEAAHPDHRAGPHLPQRSRRHPLAHVPSGRGIGCG